jgi:hypothetical protein
MDHPAQISLSIYPYGVILRKYSPDDGFSEYAIDPNQLVEALALKVGFSSGLLAGDILSVSQQGNVRAVVGYRKPARARLLVEGTSRPFEIPLPGLVMLRKVSGGQVSHQVYAAGRRPGLISARLYAAPLPNVSASNGDVCWGSVPKPSKQSLAGSDLSEDWQLLLGTPFNAHSVRGKSQRFPDDIRQMFSWLEQARPRRYPTVDLVEARATFGALLGDRP